MREVHPLAQLLPPLSEKEYADLKADIERRGEILRPIVLYQDKILSGVHRERACEELGIAPTYVTFEGTDSAAADMVASLELLIRSVSPSQKAMVSAAMKGYLDSPGPKNGFSKRTLAHARKVLDKGVDEVKEAVRDGTVSVSDASDNIVHLEPEKQRKVVEKIRSGKEKNARGARKQNHGDAYEGPDDDGSVPDPDVDRNGAPIPPALKDVFGTRMFSDAVDSLSKIIENMDGASWHPFILHSILSKSLKSALDMIQKNMPAIICPSCSGAGCREACRGSGWLPQWRADEIRNTGGGR